MYAKAGELIGNLIPFGILLYLTLAVFGVIKLKNKPKVFENPPLYYKAILVIGLAAFAFLIANNITGSI